MWLDKLKDLKKQSGMSAKQIAEKANMSERTVTRIINGETYAPGIDKLRDIVYAMGGSLDDILDESDFKLPTPLVESLKNENTTLQNAVNDLTAENVTLKDKIVALEVELDRLRLILEHKEEIIALHNYYNKLKSNN
ncbi:MAG: helix-turn-helix transcriptional regulator [Ruminococcaceae bacterium]|nr:helix-turn-helix transcriptional regulator [Oscillospiraceae bacterium]